MNKLNPITQSVMCLTLVTAAFFMPPFYRLFLIIAIAVLNAVSGTLKGFLKAMAGACFLFVMIVGVNSFLVPAPTVLWRFGALTLYAEGLYRSLNIVSNLLVIIGAFYWFFTLVDMKNLTICLMEMGMPNSAAYIILATFQMIPQMSKRSKVIMDAQRARGMETEGSVFVRAKAFLPSVGPLIISSLLNTEEQALTLEARGFSCPAKKTTLQMIETTAKDKLIRVLFTAALAMIIVIRILTWTGVIG